MYKVFIRKREIKPGYTGEFVNEYVCIDSVKPYDFSEDEWESLKPLVEMIACGNDVSRECVSVNNCNYELNCIVNEKDWCILAESEHYYIKNEYEDAILFRKPDSKRLASVGYFYGDPEAAYIDDKEQFCITIGCGIIKYNLCESFEDYMDNKTSTQWIETGNNPDSIEWCDSIEEVTESYIMLSCEGEKLRKFNLQTLEKME